MLDPLIDKQMENFLTGQIHGSEKFGPVGLVPLPILVKCI